MEIGCSSIDAKCLVAICDLSHILERKHEPQYDLF